MHDDVGDAFCASLRFPLVSESILRLATFRRSTSRVGVVTGGREAALNMESCLTCFLEQGMAKWTEKRDGKELVRMLELQRGLEQSFVAISPRSDMVGCIEGSVGGGSWRLKNAKGAIRSGTLHILIEEKCTRVDLDGMAISCTVDVPPIVHMPSTCVKRTPWSRIIKMVESVEIVIVRAQCLESLQKVCYTRENEHIP